MDSGLMIFVICCKVLIFVQGSKTLFSSFNISDIDGILVFFFLIKKKPVKINSIIKYLWNIYNKICICLDLRHTVKTPIFSPVVFKSV